MIKNFYPFSKKILGNKQGFLLVEIMLLVLILTVLTTLFITLGKYLRAHLINESWVTAIYLADGELDHLEYLGEEGRLEITDYEHTMDLNNWQYVVHTDIKETKLGLMTATITIKWRRDNHEFQWQISRQILNRGAGSIPLRTNGTNPPNPNSINYHSSPQ